MKNEADVTRIVCGALRGRAAIVFAIVGSEMQQAGWPDRYVAHRMWTGWLEFKWLNGQLRPLQRAILQQLSDRNVPAFVCRWIDGSIRLETYDGDVLADGIQPHDGRRMLEALKEASRAKGVVAREELIEYLKTLEEVRRHSVQGTLAESYEAARKYQRMLAWVEKQED